MNANGTNISQITYSPEPASVHEARCFGHPSRSRPFSPTIDPAEVDYGGNESDTFSFDGTNGAASQPVTFTPILTGTDGTRLVAHETGHFTANADGVVTVSLDRFTEIRGCP